MRWRRSHDDFELFVERTHAWGPLLPKKKKKSSGSSRGPGGYGVPSMQTVPKGGKVIESAPYVPASSPSSGSTAAPSSAPSSTSPSAREKTSASKKYGLPSSRASRSRYEQISDENDNLLEIGSLELGKDLPEAKREKREEAKAEKRDDAFREEIAKAFIKESRAKVQYNNSKPIEIVVAKMIDNAPVFKRPNAMNKPAVQKAFNRDLAEYQRTAKEALTKLTKSEQRRGVNKEEAAVKTQNQFIRKWMEVEKVEKSRVLTIEDSALKKKFKAIDKKADKIRVGEWKPDVYVEQDDKGRDVVRLKRKGDEATLMGMADIATPVMKALEDFADYNDRSAFITQMGWSPSTSDTLGVAMEALSRPMKFSLALNGRLMAHYGIIKGDTAEKIKDSKNPVEALLGTTDKPEVTGADISQGVFDTKKLGIVFDLAMDPLMYVGVGEIKASVKGAEEAAQMARRIEKAQAGFSAERLERRIVAATEARDFSGLNKYLREIAEQNKIDLSDLGKTAADKKISRQIKGRVGPVRRAKEMIYNNPLAGGEGKHFAQAAKEAREIRQANRGSAVEEIMAKAIKERADRQSRDLGIDAGVGPTSREVFAPSAHTGDAVVEAGNWARRNTTDPGLEFRVTTPLGNKIFAPVKMRFDGPVSGRLLGRIPSFTNSIGGGDFRNMTKATGSREMQLARVRDARIAQDTRAQFLPEIEDALEQWDKAKRAASGPQPSQAVSDAAKDAERRYNRLLGEIDDEIAQRQSKANSMRRLGANLLERNELKNRRRFSHSVYMQSFNDERRLYQEYMYLVEKAVAPLKNDQPSLGRVVIKMATENATGIDHAALKLTAKEREVQRNLQRVTEQLGDHGMVNRTLMRIVEENNWLPRQFYSRRAGVFGDVPTAQGIEKTPANKSGAAQVGRGEFEMASMTTPEALGKTIETLWPKLGKNESIDLADQVFNEGRIRVGTELTARFLSRQNARQPEKLLHMDDLAEIQKQAIKWAGYRAKNDKTQPLFGNPELTEGVVTLGKGAERHGIDPNLYVNAPAAEAVKEMWLANGEDIKRLTDLIESTKDKKLKDSYQIMRKQLVAERDELHAAVMADGPADAYTIEPIQVGRAEAKAIQRRSYYENMKANYQPGNMGLSRDLSRERRKYNPDPNAVSSRTWYHGSGTKGLTAEQLDAGKTEEGLWGQGVYLTSKPNVDRGYARDRAWHEHSSPQHYEVKLNVEEVLDLEDMYTPELSKVMRDFHPDDPNWAAAVDEADVRMVEWYEALAENKASGDFVAGDAEDFTNGDWIRHFEIELHNHPRNGLTSALSGRAIDGITRDINRALSTKWDALTHRGGRNWVSRTQGDHQTVVILEPQLRRGVVERKVSAERDDLNYTFDESPHLRAYMETQSWPMENWGSLDRGRAVNLQRFLDGERTRSNDTRFFLERNGATPEELDEFDLAMEEAGYVSDQLHEQLSSRPPFKLSDDAIEPPNRPPQVERFIERRDKNRFFRPMSEPRPTTIYRIKAPTGETHNFASERAAWEWAEDRLTALQEQYYNNLPRTPSPQYAQSVRDWRETHGGTGMMPDLNPLTMLDRHTRSVARKTAEASRIRAIHDAYGLDIRDTVDQATVKSTGEELFASELREVRNADDELVGYRNQHTLDEYDVDDIQFHEKSLVPIMFQIDDQGIKRAIRWVDRNGREYQDARTYVRQTESTNVNQDAASREELLNQVLAAEGRPLWPTDIMRDFGTEYIRMGEFDAHMIREGGRHLFLTLMENIRAGVTTLFPAFHTRNMISDLLQSLQQDSGVMFHPIMNFKLTMLMLKRDAKFTGGWADKVPGMGYVRVPGVGKMPTEDYLLMLDVFQGRSTNMQVADLGLKATEATNAYDISPKVLGRTERGVPTFNLPNAAKRTGQFFNPKAKGGLMGLGRTGKLGHTAQEFSARREDIARQMTFMQAMRRNGGDAADATWKMVQTHFDYGDLTMYERKVIRNLFLFYTWYRKNIPRQLYMIVHRPGFFNAINSFSQDLMDGATPLNQDWSQYAPWLPNTEGEMKNKGLIPDYIWEQAPVAMNWNNHAFAVPFGAPWGDLAIINKALQGDFTKIAMLGNPLLTTGMGYLKRSDLLTGRRYKDEEASGAASIAQWFAEKFGFELPENEDGEPMLPWTVMLGLSNIPLFGRGSSYFSGTVPAEQDQGRARSYVFGGPGRALLGMSGYMTPAYAKPGESERNDIAWLRLVADRGWKRMEFAKDLSDRKNDPGYRDRMLAKFDRETMGWLKDKGVPREYWRVVPNLGDAFYQSVEEKNEAKARNAITIATGTGTTKADFSEVFGNEKDEEDEDLSYNEGLYEGLKPKKEPEDNEITIVTGGVNFGSATSDEITMPEEDLEFAAQMLADDMADKLPSEKARRAYFARNFAANRVNRDQPPADQDSIAEQIDSDLMDEDEIRRTFPKAKNREQKVELAKKLIRLRRKVKNGIYGKVKVDPKKYTLFPHDVATRIMNRAMTEHGFTKEAAAGLVGNAVQESSLDPNAGDPNGYGGLFGFTAGELNWGVVQEAIRAQGKDPFTDVEAQVDYALTHGTTSVFEKMNAAKTPEEAARLFMVEWERPADQSESAQAGRGQNARDVYDALIGLPGGKKARQKDKAELKRLEAKAKAWKIYKVPKKGKNFLPVTIIDKWGGDSGLSEVNKPVKQLAKHLGRVVGETELPIISGYRGGDTDSNHGYGNALDVEAYSWDHPDGTKESIARGNKIAYNAVLALGGKEAADAYRAKGYNEWWGPNGEEVIWGYNDSSTGGNHTDHVHIAVPNGLSAEQLANLKLKPVSPFQQARAEIRANRLLSAGIAPSGTTGGSPSYGTTTSPSGGTVSQDTTASGTGYLNREALASGDGMLGTGITDAGESVDTPSGEAVPVIDWYAIEAATDRFTRESRERLLKLGA